MKHAALRFETVTIDGKPTRVAYMSHQAPGAIPEGTRIEKCESEPLDAKRDGEQGFVIGSIDVRGEHIPTLLKFDFCYWVRWDSDNAPCFILGYKIKPAADSTP